MFTRSLSHGVSLSGPQHLPCSAFHFPNLCGLPLRLLRLVVPHHNDAAERRVRRRRRASGIEGGRKEGRLKHVLGHVCRDRYAHIVLSSCCLQSRLAALIGFRRGWSLPLILPLKTVTSLWAENLLLSISLSRKKTQSQILELFRQGL